MFVPDKPFQLSLKFVGKARSLKNLDLAGKARQGQRSTLLLTFANYSNKTFNNSCAWGLYYLL